MKKILSMAAILVINPIISMEQSISTTIDASKLASACCIATEFFREGYRKFPLNFNEMLSLGDICGLGKLLRLSHVKNIVDAHLGKLSSASQVIIEFSLMENNTLHPLSVCQNIYRFLWYSDTRSFFASNLIVETVDSAISHQCMSEEDRAFYMPFLKKFRESDGDKWDYYTEFPAIANCLNDIARENLMKFTVSTGKAIDGMSVFKIDTEATISALPEPYGECVRKIRAESDMIPYLKTDFFDLSQLDDEQTEFFWKGVGDLLDNPISRDHLIRVVAARFYMYADSAPKISVRQAAAKETTHSAAYISSDNTIEVKFEKYKAGVSYIDYNPLCRLDQKEKIAREVSLPFHEMLSHEIGHYFDYIVFANLDFLKQDAGMIGLLSSATFRNIFFPNTIYIPALKETVYETIFKPLLDAFVKVFTEGDGNMPNLKNRVGCVFTQVFAESYYDFMQENAFKDVDSFPEDITTLQLCVNSIRTRKIAENVFDVMPIDQEMKLRSDLLVESLFLRFLYGEFTNSGEILRIHGVKIIDLDGRKNVILDPCCDFTLAKSKKRPSRWQHATAGGTVVSAKLPTKAELDAYIKKEFIDAIISNAGALLKKFSDDIASIFSAYPTKSVTDSAVSLYSSTYKPAFASFFNSLFKIIIGDHLTKPEEDVTNSKAYVGHLHSPVPEGNPCTLWKLFE